MNRFQREMRNQRINSERINKLLIRGYNQQKAKAELERKLFNYLLDETCPERKRINEKEKEKSI